MYPFNRNEPQDANLVVEESENQVRHPLNPPSQHALSIHPINTTLNTTYQHTSSTQPINTHHQPTLSTHPINTPYQLTLPTPSQPTLSSHPNIHPQTIKNSIITGGLTIGSAHNSEDGNRAVCMACPTGNKTPKHPVTMMRHHSLPSLDKPLLYRIHPLIKQVMKPISPDRP